MTHYRNCTHSNDKDARVQIQIPAGFKIHFDRITVEAAEERDGYFVFQFWNKSDLVGFFDPVPIDRRNSVTVDIAGHFEACNKNY